MANRIKISLISASGPSQDPGIHAEAVDQMIEYWRQNFDRVLPDRPDLIVVPEMCDQYPHHALQVICESYLEERGDRLLNFFCDTARANRCYMTYPSLRCNPGGGWFNSVHLIDRCGEIIGTYDKNHPTISELEAGIRPGQEASIIECEFGRIACVVCFDLNFDELRQQYANSRPDLILFTSMYHGGLMQAYWAYSCRAHLASAVTGLPGHLISPVGEVLASTTNYVDHVTATANLDCRVVHLDDNRPKLAEIKNRDGPQVTISDPGLLGSVLLTSESDRTAQQLVDEFQIELLDHYLDRSRWCRQDRLTG